MLEHFLRQVDGCKLPDSIKETLRGMELTEDIYNDFVYLLQNIEYYTILGRIEKGYKWIAQQTDEQQIEQGKAKIQKLSDELERLKP